jgi:hypothetical protein
MSALRIVTPVLIVGARTAGTSHCMRRCQAVTAPDAYAKNEASHKEAAETKNSALADRKRGVPAGHDEK